MELGVSYTYSSILDCFGLAKVDIVHDDVGRGTFLAIFVSSGVVASYASLSGYVLRNILYTSSLGASGAASGLLGAWCWLHAS